MIPLAGPSANDEPVLVEDTVEQHVELLGISAQLFVGVEDARVLVVTVKFQNIAGAVGDRLRAGEHQQSNDCRLNPALAERVFHEPVEIRRDNYADIAATHKVSHRVVRRGRYLPSFFPILVGGLDVAVQDGTALLGRGSEFFQQLGIVGFLAGFFRYHAAQSGCSSTPCASATRRMRSSVISQPVGISAARERPEPSSMANTPLFS